MSVLDSDPFDHEHPDGAELYKILKSQFPTENEAQQLIDDADGFERAMFKWGAMEDVWKVILERGAREHSLRSLVRTARKSLGEAYHPFLDRIVREGPQILNIAIGGTSDQWHFRPTRGNEPLPDHTIEIEVLGSRILRELIFGWLHHLHWQDEEDYIRAGNTLGAALLDSKKTTATDPRHAAGDVGVDTPNQVSELAHLDHFDGINLMFEKDSPLADIPWELSIREGTEPSIREDTEPKECLGARASFEFTRSIKKLTNDAPPPEALARALVVGPGYVICDMYTAASGADGITYKELAPKEGWDEVGLTMKQCRPHLLQYIGFASTGDDGPQLFVGRDARDTKWVSLKRVAESAAANQTRLLIIQTLLPPFGERWFVKRPSDFAAALTGSVGAVLYTQYPVSKQAVKFFNMYLQSYLSAGETIETSVQKTRRDLAQEGPDPWAFGSFSLITNGQRGLRLVFRSQPEDVATQEPIQQDTDAGTESRETSPRAPDKLAT